MTSEISKLEAYYYATKDVIVGVDDLTIEQATSMINDKGFRRLPIVADTKLIGMVTVTDILKFFVANRRKRPLNELFREQIAYIMTKNVLTLPCDAPLIKATEIMFHKRIGSLPLMSNDNLVGIITERDLLAHIPKISTEVAVRDIMTTQVHTASPQQTVFEAMELMEKVGFRRLPIITDDKGLVGIVCASDLLRHLVDPSLKQGQEEEIFDAPLEEIMTTSIIYTEPDTSLSEAASTMAWKRLGALPVIDVTVTRTQCRYGCLVGIVTERDILYKVTHPFHETLKS
ncbi:MAG: CBS domain-containing protein [Candidatus Heimdallarchaeota archaeon]